MAPNKMCSFFMFLATAMVQKEEQEAKTIHLKSRGTAAPQWL
jgi:hypothetical protein